MKKPHSIMLQVPTKKPRTTPRALRGHTHIAEHHAAEAAKTHTEHHGAK